MKRGVLVNIIAYFFILLFFYTGVAKLIDLHRFKDQLISSPFLGPAAGLITWGLPVTEILIAFVLLVPRWQLKGLYVSLVLMIIFTIYLICILLIDTHLNCSCGGIIENLSPRQHLLFNSAAVALALIAILAVRGGPSSVLSSLRSRWLQTAATFLLFGAIGWSLRAAMAAPAQTRTGLEGRLLPSFNLLLADSLTHLNTANIPAGKPFIMVGFSPYCMHCQAEMREIIKNITRFGDTSIYFVTSYSYSDMKKFYDAFRLKRFPNIITGVDSSDAFLRYFKANFIPYIAVYDAEKRLKEVLPGEAKAETLSKSLRD